MDCGAKTATQMSALAIAMNFQPALSKAGNPPTH